MFYEVENTIAGVIGYDSIRKHLAECGYHTVEIREKYYDMDQVIAAVLDKCEIEFAGAIV